MNKSIIRWIGPYRPVGCFLVKAARGGEIPGRGVEVYSTGSPAGVAEGKQKGGWFPPDQYIMSRNYVRLDPSSLPNPTPRPCQTPLAKAAELPSVSHLSTISTMVPSPGLVRRLMNPPCALSTRWQ